MAGDDIGKRTDEQSHAPGEQQNATDSDQREMRRRLIKAGVAAVPFILTLRARPVRAMGPYGDYGYGPSDPGFEDPYNPPNVDPESSGPGDLGR